MAFNPVPLENVPSTSTNTLFKPMQVVLTDDGGGGVPAEVAWGDITGKPAVIAAGADQAAARTAIGAGTGSSNLAVGSAVPKTSTANGTAGTATSAAREDHQHPDPTIARVTGLQAALDAKATSAALAALEARVAVLEGAGA